jgi:hypothetical protein
VWLLGLPDGILSNPKSLLGYILEDLGIDNVCIFCGRLEYFTTIWNILQPFGIFTTIWYVTYMAIGYIMFVAIWFFPVLVCCTRKYGNPGGYDE